MKTTVQTDIDNFSTDWNMKKSIKKSYKQPPQLLKWVGNKQRFAQHIVEQIPENFDTYIEPFVGTGAVLGCLHPERAIAGDTLEPLIDLWNLIKNSPQKVVEYYKIKIDAYNKSPKEVYEEIKLNYNSKPNPLDLLFISRTCYGGVMRFTKDGRISTPIGPHKPISGITFEIRVREWSDIVKKTQFLFQSFEQTMSLAKEGDVIYCDPPYLESQSILYGSQSFSAEKLWESIEECKDKGAKVLLSIDGKKKSGKVEHRLTCPCDLFERELYVDCGISMLKRFQKKGDVMINENVHDRLLLTW